jgi:hypothetical protein
MADSLLNFAVPNLAVTDLLERVQIGETDIRHLVASAL